MALYADLTGKAVITETRKAAFSYWILEIGTAKTTGQDCCGHSEYYDSDQISQVVQGSPHKEYNSEISYDENGPEFKNDFSLFKKSVV
jgi:hypothetical protein